MDLLYYLLSRRVIASAVDFLRKCPSDTLSLPLDLLLDPPSNLPSLLENEVFGPLCTAPFWVLGHCLQRGTDSSPKDINQCRLSF